MPNVEIKCVNKLPREDPFHAITHVGGYVTSQWKLTLAEAIDAAEKREWDFYVSRGGRSAWVVVRVAPSGRKYLKTEDDSFEPNNLLSLPECP